MKGLVLIEEGTDMKYRDEDEKNFYIERDIRK